MDWNLNYGELSNDKEFVNNCENLKENLQELQQVLDQLLPLKKHYDKMTIPAQIELDLFLVFTMNSLQWINLRIQGVDLTTHPISHELERIQAVMKKWEEVKDRDKRPIVDVGAAKRFIKSGLYDSKAIGQPQNKKKKFSEDTE